MAEPKEKRFRTPRHRWGSGKVHRLVYDRVNHLWYPACKSVGDRLHGDEVDSDTPVTCKKCGTT